MFECFGVLKLDRSEGDDRDEVWFDRVNAAFAQAQDLFPGLFETQDLRWRNAEAALMVLLAKNRDLGQAQEIEAFVAELGGRGVAVSGRLTVRHIEDDGEIRESLLTIAT